MHPALFLLLLTLTLSPQRATADEPPTTCTYTTYRWSVPLKRAVDRRTVRHPYAELRPEEVDAATGCSICEEDQEWIVVADLPPFRLCRKLAPQVGATLQRLAESGVPLVSLTGYRVGMTRGPIDAEGLRWGGEIAGRQKDFMHFSPTGY